MNNKIIFVLTLLLFGILSCTNKSSTGVIPENKFFLDFQDEIIRISGDNLSLSSVFRAPDLSPGSNEKGNWTFKETAESSMTFAGEEGTLRTELAEFSGIPNEPIDIVKIINTNDTWNSITEKVSFAELRLIPRSNFLQQKYPLPLNQGMRGWFWTGHYVWTYDILPAADLYNNRVTHRGDFEWSVNQVHLVAEATSVPGEIRVFLDTLTPGFETFVVQVDKQKRLNERSSFLWRLHSGRNLIEVKTRNIACREGSSSWIVLDYEYSVGFYKRIYLFKL